MNLCYQDVKKNVSATILIIACSFVLTFVSCKKSFKQIIGDTEKAVFIVYAYDEYGAPMGSGTGFFIEKEGIAVTNYHVLDNAIKAVIRTVDNNQYEIDSVLLSSRQNDIAVFRVKNPDNHQFSILHYAKENPEKGDKIYVIGSPLGLTSSVSEGIVSSYRQDSHGDIVQTTAAISEGSSGSPMLNTKGQVFAVASFKRKGAENINFGVIVNENFREKLNDKEFYKKNRKFSNSKSKFVLLNIMPDNGSDLMLNAIEFGPTATTAYLTFTNMHLSEGWTIWCEIGKKDKGFYIEDLDSHKRYYATSSSLAPDKEKAKTIGIGTSIQFKVNFPVIKDELSKITVSQGESDRLSHFSDIDIENYRDELNIDEYTYQRNYAFNYTTDGGNYLATMSLLSDLLEETPSDIISLNMMAILSYVMENKADAMYYFTEAIEQNPNDELAYVNRGHLYALEGNYTDAASDFTAAINLCTEQPDYYWDRANIYYYMKEYQEALADLNKTLEITHDEDGFKNSPDLYELRAYVYYFLNKKQSAIKDVEKAYRLSSNQEQLNRLYNFYKAL